MKKLSTVALSLVLATALMGAGYASWQTTLGVGTTVQTANFSFVYSNPYLHQPLILPMVSVSLIAN